MKIAEISIKRPTLVIVIFTILTLGGILSYFSMSYELIPKFEINVVSVATVYPGASPSEVETTVTKEIDDAISSLENVKKIESKSFEGLSLVMITLNEDADADKALDDAQREINAILSEFPDDVKAPSLEKFSMDDLPIITAGATSNLNNKEFYDLLDKKIQPLLSRVKGVAQVNLIGGQEREIKVNLDQSKLEAYGLSIPQVQQVILSSNLDFPTGNIKTRKSSTIIRLSGKYKDVEELSNLVVSNQDGIQIRLKDIAFVEDAEKDVEKVARIDRKPAMLLQVTKQSDANAVEVSELIHKSLKDIEEEYADQEVNLQVVNDTSTFTLAAANGVIGDLFIAILLVAIVMLLFMHSIRNAFIVTISIPLSLIATFIGMELMGYTLNLMSLLGLSLVVGILVDDAIVVLENIYRHMEMGKGRIRAAYDGAAEIGLTVSGITLVIIVVFLPIALSSGLVPDILEEFSMTVVFATLFSLLSSFTVVPWLASRFGKLEKLSGRTWFSRFILAFEQLLNRFTHWVSNLLKACLKNKTTKILTVVIVTIVFVLSFGLTKFIGGEFMPSIDKSEFLVQIELPKDASVEQTNFMTQKAEAFLASQPEIKRIITTVGEQSDDFGGAQATDYKSEVDVLLVDKDEREDNTYVYAAKIRNKLSKELVGAKVRTVPVGLMGAERAPLALVVTGSDLDSINKFASQAMDSLRTIKGASEIKLSSEAGNPEINVSVDRDKMAALGLDIQTVGLSMQTAFSGNTDGKFRSGDYEYDINIRLRSADRSNIENVENLKFVNDKGELIKLQQFAKIEESSGPSFLERRDKTPSVTIEAQTIGVPTGTVANEWEKKFEEIKRPTGVNYVWSGDMEMQTEGFGSLGIALLAAIILVYLIMVALYDSFVYPFVVMFSVPLAIIGVLIILALTNNSLNTFTILGMIMLIGLVAKNAILLVDFANQRKAAGENTFNALVQANHARLRPILMTTIAMVFGMLPIAMASGDAAEMNNGLAWVVIGGLISSLFLTLIFVPVVYSIFDGILHRFNKGKGKVDYEKEMHADYEHLKLSDDGFTPEHS